MIADKPKAARRETTKLVTAWIYCRTSTTPFESVAEVMSHRMHMTTLARVITLRVVIRLLCTAKKVLIAAAPITCGTRLAFVAFGGTFQATLFALGPQGNASIHLKSIESSIFVRFFTTSEAYGKNENDEQKRRCPFGKCHATLSILLIVTRYSGTLHVFIVDTL